MEFSDSDLGDLKRARSLLESRGLVVAIADALGTPIAKIFGAIPGALNSKVAEITRIALSKATDVAVSSLKDIPGKKASTLRHKIAVITTGGVAGFFGFPALAVELPITTTIMLRSIADIARDEGERITSISSKLACLEVFGLGGPSSKDDASESGYFAIRLQLARYTTKAAEYITEKGLVQRGAPVLVRFLAQVAERFSIQVSEKLRRKHCLRLVRSEAHS